MNLRRSIACAIVGAPLALGLTSCGSLPEADLAPTAPRLRVVTYNINWGMVNPEAVANYLRAADADVVCLQETHARWETFLQARLGAQYPHSMFIASDGAGGIAILAKTPLYDARALPAAAGWFPALRAEVETPIGRVQILNVHLRPPLSDRGSATPSALYRNPQIHRAELRTFLAAMDLDTPLVIAGDFNEHEDDGAASELRRRHGFTDALTLFDARSPTWKWPVTSNLALRRRYDHVLFSPHLRCTGARVDAVDASDHQPVLTVLKRSAPPG